MWCYSKIGKINTNELSDLNKYSEVLTVDGGHNQVNRKTTNLSVQNDLQQILKRNPMKWKVSDNIWTLEGPGFRLLISATLFDKNLYAIEYHRKPNNVLKKTPGLDVISLTATSIGECKENLLQLLKKIKEVSPALEDALTQLTPLTPWRKLESLGLWQVKEDPFILTLSTTHSGYCLSLVIHRPSGSWKYIFNGSCPKQLSFDLREQMVVLGQNLPRTILIALSKLPIEQGEQA